MHCNHDEAEVGGSHQNTDMKLLLFFEFILFIVSTVGHLDFEELQSIHYGIDIIDKPVVAGLESDSDVSSMRLTSKHGQDYQCVYHDRRHDEQKEQEEEKAAMETGIAELLKPMETAPCLQHTKGWWTYELCYKKEIRQFHMEDGQPTGTILYLGHYESEKDWSNYTKPKSTRSAKFGGEILRAYHSQQYVNGSLCDLTNQARRTEVRVSCKEGMRDLLFSVEEPETCAYILHVQTGHVCSHPYLKPPSTTQAVPITCHPLLTQTQYDLYLQHEQERELAREEAMAKLQGKDKASVDEAEHSESDGAEEVSGDVNDPLLQSLMQSIQAALGQDTQDVKMKMRYIDKASDISKVVQDMLASEKASKQKVDDDGVEAERGVEEKEELEMSGTDDEMETGQATAGEMEEEETLADDTDDDDGDDDLEDGEVETEGDEEDDDVLKDFEQELDDITGGRGVKEKLSKYKGNIESAMQAKFSEILDEAQMELGDEAMEDVDRGQAFKELTKTLTNLLKRLDTTERELKNVDDILQEKEKQLAGEKAHLMEMDDEEAADDDDKEEEEADDLFINVAARPPPPTSLRQSYEQLLRAVAFARQLRADEARWAGFHKYRQHLQQQRLEKKWKMKVQNDPHKVSQVLKGQLQQQLGDHTGRKVEVKIITELVDDSYRDLYTDAEGKPVDRIVFAVVTENDDEIREQRHHHQMEKAYNFAWSNKNKKKTGES